MASRQSFLILCFIAFLNWMSYGLVFPFFAASLFNEESIFLAGAHGTLRGFTLGVLLSASPLAQFFSSPVIGSLSDQIGRKFTLQITIMIMVVGYLISAFGVWIESIWFLILGRIVTGIGAGNIAIINSSVADLSEPKSKTKNFALITMANGLGFSIGPFIGGKLATLGYDMPFIFSGLLTLLCFFIFSWRFRETHPKEKDGWSTFVLRLRHLVKTINLRKFRIFFLAFFIFCFGWSFYWEFIPVTWIKFYGLNVSQIGNFYAYGSAIYVLSSGLLIRPIIKRFKPLPILLFSLAALALCLFPLPFGTSWLYWIFIPLQQFLIALIFPVSTTIVSNAVAESRQGETLGAFQSLQSFAFAVTPFLGGALLHFNYNITVLLGGASMVLTCLILLNYKKHSMTKGARL